MRLKYQLLLLGLLSLLFPITAWFALKSVDKEFRLNIEQASKNTLLSLKASVQEILQNNPQLAFNGLIPKAINDLEINGSDSEWIDVTPYIYNNQTGELAVKVGYDSEGISLYIETNDASINNDSLILEENDQIIIAIADDRGLYKYTFSRQAEGFLLKDKETLNRPEFTGYWHEKSKGYSVEIKFKSKAIQ